MLLELGVALLRPSKELARRPEHDLGLETGLGRLVEDHRGALRLAHGDHVVARRACREHGEELVLFTVVSGASFEQRVRSWDDITPDDLRFADHLVSVSR